MQWCTWWQLLLAVQARSLLAASQPTLCAEPPCRCDAFARVVCNCTQGNEEVTLRPYGSYKVPSLATSIILDGCSRVQFLPDTITTLLQLRTVEIRNVAYAILGERSLIYTPHGKYALDLGQGIKIIIHNSTVEEISSYAIQGHVDEILISNSRIKTIEPFAFSSLSYVKNIEFKNNVFDNIEPQAFKKFETVNFSFQGGTMRTLPSRFISDVDVSNVFKLDKVKIDHIHSLTFLLSSPKRIFVENNIIGTLEGDGIHASVDGSVIFRNNTINSLWKGAFLGLSTSHQTDSPTGLPELWIDNNTVTKIKPDSLLYNRSAFTLRIDGLHLNSSCSCDLSHKWEKLVKEEGGIITCWYDLENHYTTLSTYHEARCGNFKNNFWIYVVVGLFIAAGIAAAIIFFIIKRENDKKKNVRIVMPDGKTYRETEFHIVLERAELLTTDL